MCGIASDDLGVHLVGRAGRGEEVGVAPSARVGVDVAGALLDDTPVAEEGAHAVFARVAGDVVRLLVELAPEHHHLPDWEARD